MQQLSGGADARRGRTAEQEAHQTGMQVDRSNPPVGSGHEQLGLNELLDGEDDAVLAPQADHRPRVLHGLVGILDLRGPIILFSLCFSRRGERRRGRETEGKVSGKGRERTWKMRPSGE